MKRRILSFFCVVAFCLTLLSATVFAVDTPLTTLRILGTDIAKESGTTYWKYDDATSTVTGATEDNYTIKYDGNGTLTLNGIDITYTTSAADGLRVIDANGDLTIVLEGENKFNVTRNVQTANEVTGIYLTKGDLTIQEDSNGSLNMTVNNYQAVMSSYTRNIYTKEGSVKLESGTFVFTVSGSGMGQNLNVAGDLHIGEATVNVNNTINSGFGIYIGDKGTMTVSEKAEVTITSNTKAFNGQEDFYIGAKRYGVTTAIKRLEIKDGTVKTSTTYTETPTDTLPNKNVDELYVNGTDILAATDYTVKCGSGTATYDITSNTLTLEDATIDKGHKESGTAYGIYAEGTDSADALKINLKGTNTFSSEQSLTDAFLMSGDTQVNISDESNGELVIGQGVTMDWSKGSYTFMPQSVEITNNGIFKLPSDYSIRDLNFKGSGVVQVSNTYYTNDGTAFTNAVSGNISVTVDTEDKNATGYTWTNENGVWTLTLNNAYVDGSVEIKFPRGNNDKEIAI